MVGEIVMMPPTEEHEIVPVGTAAVLPCGDVMRFTLRDRTVTAWEAAAPITNGEDGEQVMVHGAHAAAGVEYHGGAVGDEPVDAAVAQQRRHRRRIDRVAVERVRISPTFELLEGQHYGHLRPAAAGGGGPLTVVERRRTQRHQRISAALRRRALLPVHVVGHRGLERRLYNLEPGCVEMAGQLTATIQPGRQEQ